MKGICLVSAATLLIVCGAAAPAGGGKTDKDKLQGAWELHTISYDGRTDKFPEGKRMQLVFKGEKVGRSDRKELDDFKLDEAKTPREIDLVKSDGTQRGLYELKGDTLRMAFRK